MYTYTDWQIMLLGIENWLALGATKIVVPVQSASSNTLFILKEYEKAGIEESHVNCLHFVKPWADMVAFSDIDDMLIPTNPMDVHSRSDIEILQMCTIGRVDSVNMHETGIHRFGYVQVRVPCHKAHFYHMRHSYGEVGHETSIDMRKLMDMLNKLLSKAFTRRITTSLIALSNVTLSKSSTESFADFDRCMSAINDEHWSLRVSRCLTPHVCYSRLIRNVDCMASLGRYEFMHVDGDFIIVPMESKLVRSEQNCESPPSTFVNGNHFYLP
uniref:Glycosyltransferase family 92 protein n=1 Tax=Parascaris equorum TaxID=6256 RepID=A0A914RKJ0_PAREQ